MRVAFSERELDVMTVLWDLGPSTAGEVRGHLADDLAYNTVLTVLRVLEEKGHVGHVVEGKAHRYRALVDRGRAGQSAVARLLDTVFGGSAELLLTHLVRDERVDADEIDRLRRVLDERIEGPAHEQRGRGERPVIAAWMLYTTLVAALLAAAAHAFERGCRLVRLPGRWPWAAALLLALLVPLAATRPEATMTAQPRARAARGAGPESAREQPPQTSALARVPAVVVVPPGTPLAALDRPLLALWLVASFGWCVVLAGSAIRLAGRETTWRPLVVDGVPVLVSHDVGPALVGVLTPRIVLPAWTLELPRERRALVIAHEREHALARDPLLLLAGAVAVAIAPWNAALWYAFARLRLAVEADCDSRVLRSRPDVRAYGSVLLDVSARAVAGAAPVAALAESATQLSRRLDLITARPVRFVALRLGGAALASLTLAALACRTPQPTVAASPTALMAARPAQFDSLQRELAAMIPHLDTISREVAQITAAMPRLARRQREMATEMHLRGTPDSTLRRAVAEHYPAALAGGVGREPMLWFVVDARNVVLRTATGRDGLSRWSPARVRDSMQMFLLSMSDSARAEAETHGIEYLDVKAARRKFPELRRAGAEPDFMQWSSVHAGPDTVSVIWIRLRPGATLR